MFRQLRLRDLPATAEAVGDVAVVADVDEMLQTLHPPDGEGSFEKRSVWIWRALMTRSRMTADGSPGCICESWAKGTAWISQWMSMR